MKTTVTIKVVTLWFALTGLMSCKTELDHPTPIEIPTVQFVETAVTIDENQKEKRLELNLSKPAQRDGSVSIVMSSDNLDRFITEPSSINGRIELPVRKGSTSIFFMLKPVNDANHDGNGAVSLRISGISPGLTMGSRDSITVLILDDDEPLDQRVEANFPISQKSLSESATEGFLVTVSMSSAAPAPGVVGIVYSSDKLTYGTDFITEPAAENRKITLTLPAGSGHAGFKVIPINNQIFNADRSVVFTLTNGQGSVRLGQSVVLQLDILDDEPAPKINGYETVRGGWKVKRLFEYDDNNKLVKISWEQYTPAYKGGTYTYEYHQGKLHKMIENANRETYYTWTGDRIVKEEQYTNGLLSKYVLYGYDEAGNIGEAAFHYKQPDGSIKLGLLFVYLYFTDGNLYKKMAYNPIEGSGEYSLISTTTYDNYMDVANPFPLEIIPNVNSQPKLPTTVSEEANGEYTSYNFVYEFDERGRPLKRTAVSNGGSEVTTYSYR